MSKEACIKIISQMEVLWADFENLEPDRSTPTYSPASDISGFFPQFPVLIKGNGEPWTLGNLYLLRRLALKSDRYEVETYNSIAKSLLKYLRFLERENLDPLKFHPRIPLKRPTYLFRRLLLEQVSTGEISPSTASSTINAIINFYKGLASYGVLESGVLEKAHTEKEILLPIITREGLNNC
jgi:hypothetical protein